MRQKTTLLAVLCLAAATTAQRPARWSEIMIPGGVSPSGLMQRGKLVIYQDTSRVWAFSAFTGTWSSLQVSSNATLRFTNEWLLVEDGNSFSAIAAMRGVFETLNLTPAARFENPAGQRNDAIALVRDGSALFSFSGFDGHWRQLNVSPSALIGVQRNVAIVADGLAVHGLSAYSGQWVSGALPAPASAVAAGGSAAWAQVGNQVWAYSAQRESWAGDTLPLAFSAVEQGDDAVAWAGGSECLAYSGLRGSFARINTGGPVGLSSDQSLALAVQGTKTHCYSAVTGRWTTVTTAGVPTITTSAVCVALEDAAATYAYSALEDAVAVLPVAAAPVDVNWSVIAARDPVTQEYWLYSAFTGAWTKAVGATSLPQTTFNGALITTANGYRAFSARSGGIVPLTAGPTAFPHLSLQSAVIAVEDPGTALHVFDPRRDAWVTQPLLGGALQVNIWRTALVATEGQRAYGFGGGAGEVEVIDLTEMPVNALANSETASVATQNHIAGLATLATLTTSWQFPEFRRLYVRGSKMRLWFTAEPASAAAAVVGLPLQSPVSSPNGPIFLGSAGVLWIGPMPNDGVERLEFTIPDAVVLHGLQIGFQGAVLTPSGGSYFTRMSAVMLE